VRINGVGANAPYEFGRSFLATNGDGALHLLYIIAPNVLHTQYSSLDLSKNPNFKHLKLTYSAAFERLSNE